jgi:hypothetical protein
MAEIYTYKDEEVLAEGLQRSVACDQAIQTARRLAQELNEPVLLVDDDEEFVVHPDGRKESHEGQ